MKKTHVIFLSSLLVGLSCLPGYANEPLDAHEHGSASLDIAIDSNKIAVQFESPAVNIVGFEYSPDNDDQKLLIQQAKINLADFDQSFELQGDLSCQVLSFAANWNSEHEENVALEEHEEHEEQPDDLHESEHAEFQVEFELQCEKLDNLTAIDVKLFELFPTIEEIDAQVIFSGGQLKQELTANKTHFHVYFVGV